MPYDSVEIVNGITRASTGNGYEANARQVHYTISRVETAITQITLFVINKERQHQSGLRQPSTPLQLVNPRMVSTCRRMLTH